MIAAIDSNRLAARDDRAVGATQVQDHKFNAILNTASRREPAAALVKLERPVSPQEAQPRSIYGEAAPARPQITKPEDRSERPEAREAGQPRREQGLGVSTKVAERMANADSAADKSADKAEAKDDQVEDTAEQQDKHKALRNADDLPPTADQVAGAVALTGTVLTFRDIIAQSNARTVQRSINVQLGAAAYAASPHSEGEMALAQQLGAAPPPAFSQALDPKAALDGRNSVRKESELNVPSFKSDPVLVVDALAMVELSKQAQVARATAEVEGNKAPAGSALARDQFLNQIGAHGGNATTPQVAAHVQAAAVELKDLTKDLAPATKDIPVKPVDTAAPAAQPSGMPAAFATQSSDRPESLGVDKAPGDTRMVDKVMQQARWMIRDGKQEVTMRLEPESLGSLKLHVTHKDGNMHVEMTVDNAAAKHLLDSNIGQLRERFAQENLAQGSTLQVDVRHGGNSEFAQQFGRQQAEGGASTAGVRAHTTHTDESVPTARRPAWNNSNVSIYA